MPFFVAPITMNRAIDGGFTLDQYLDRTDAGHSATETYLKDLGYVCDRSNTIMLNGKSEIGFKGSEYVIQANREDLARAIKTRLPDNDEIWVAYQAGEGMEPYIHFALDLKKFEYVLNTDEDNDQLIKDHSTDYLCYDRATDYDPFDAEEALAEGDNYLREYPALIIRGLCGDHIGAKVNRKAIEQITKELYGCPVFDGDDEEPELTLQMLAYEEVTGEISSIEYGSLDEVAYQNAVYEFVNNELREYHLDDIADSVTGAWEWDTYDYLDEEEAALDLFKQNYPYLYLTEDSLIYVFRWFNEHFQSEYFSHDCIHSEDYLNYHGSQFWSDISENTGIFRTLLERCHQQAKKDYCEQKMYDLFKGDSVKVLLPSSLTEYCEIELSFQTLGINTEILRQAYYLGMGGDLKQWLYVFGNDPKGYWCLFTDYYIDRTLKLDAVSHYLGLVKDFHISLGLIADQLELPV